MSPVLGENYGGKIKMPSETHAACVFLLDVSDSMNYPEDDRPIDSLNEALKSFKEQICTDEVSRNVVDIAVVTFGGNYAEVISDFQPVVDFVPPVLAANGYTPMGEGLEKAIQLAKDRAHLYQSAGTDAHIPWIVMITDGMPTDNMERAKQLLQNEAAKGKYGHLKLWIVATKDADLNFCKSLTPRVLKMEGYDYRPIFDWTRQSMVIMSDSSVDDQIKVPLLPDNAQIVPDSWVN